jgi:transposase
MTKAAFDIAAAVEVSGSTLTELSGIGVLNAARIMARVDTVHRIRSADAFAIYTGTAPIAASSGDITPHRLSRTGDRQLNCCLHTMAITQIARDTPDGTTTVENAPPAKATEKRCVVLNDASPTSSTHNSFATQQYLR